MGSQGLCRLSSEQSNAGLPGVQRGQALYILGAALPVHSGLSETAN